MKIIIDANGGDNAPKDVIQGADIALSAYKELEIIFTGIEANVKPLIEASLNKNRMTLIPCTEIITSDDVPTKVIRSKPNSTLVVALEKLAKDDDIAGFISASSTGSILTGAFMIVGRINGISRPALAPLLPTLTGGRTILVDCGANADCKPLNLLHFAIMGSCYLESVLGVKNPKVGLLSNGTEDSKGNLLNVEAFNLLKNSTLNFVGNVEGRDMLSGEIDVCVCDGFTGNIAIKSMEGMAGSIFSMLKDGIEKGGIKSKIGYVCLKSILKDIKNKMDYNKFGGAVFLGANKPVIKVHGSSKKDAFFAAIKQCIEIDNGNVIDKIKKAIQERMDEK